jgi:hypothetical protein
MHRRRKRLRLEAQQGRIQVSEEAPPLHDNDRQRSLSSVVRTQSLAEEDEIIEKYEPVFVLDGLISTTMRVISLRVQCWGKSRGSYHPSLAVLVRDVTVAVAGNPGYSFRRTALNRARTLDRLGEKLDTELEKMFGIRRGGCAMILLI